MFNHVLKYQQLDQSYGNKLPSLHPNDILCRTSIKNFQ
ncbi:hypothetical protein J529_1935 [Acinetobacter baumannii 99063]|uniref:Uncharacterized protein n=1 Tax=Acinetobacter baumannii 99063 TaxID=1310630 RepID=A0A009TJ06_ACIBA|nr:hypothetical protein J529_1935 [Acinetobacter baumannii 99063]